MSFAAIDQFMLHVTRDEDLQDKVRDLDPQDFEGLLKIAKESGYEGFSKEEYFQAAEAVGGEWARWAALSRGESVSDELSDRELEQVAGGKGDCSTTTVCFSSFCDNMC